MSFSQNRYRHELLENGFGVRWMDDNDQTDSTTPKHSIIVVQSVHNIHQTRLPAHIWRSLAKVQIINYFDSIIVK